MNTSLAPSPQSTFAARVAGIGLLVMFFAAIYANFVVVEGLIVAGDSALTAKNILEHQLTFRLGVLGFFVVLICDVLVTWALQVYMKHLNSELSWLAAAFRLVYTAIFAAAVTYLYLALPILQSSTAVFTTAQREAQALMSLEIFQQAWLIGLLFFGFHLLTLGYLILSTKHVPQAIGFLLLLAGVAYTCDTFARFFLVNYDDYKTILLPIVAIPAAVGELSLCVWLLMRGFKKATATRAITSG